MIYHFEVEHPAGSASGTVEAASQEQAIQKVQAIYAPVELTRIEVTPES